MTLTLALIGAAFLAGIVAGILIKVALHVEIEDRRAIRTHSRVGHDPDETGSLLLAARPSRNAGR